MLQNLCCADGRKRFIEAQFANAGERESPGIETLGRTAEERRCDLRRIAATDARLATTRQVSSTERTFCESKGKTRQSRTW